MSSITPAAPGQAHPSGTWALRVSAHVLMCVVWASSAMFGLYILAFYGRALTTSQGDRWNTVLPGLHVAQEPAGNAAMGLHFAAGGVILLLGCVQLLQGLRTRWPVVHRAVGRVYVVAAILAGIAGLFFILARGTIGGIVMDIGFGLYGVLMVLAAVQAFRHARARRIEAHRAWALRLFALAIGSWLYRMDYGIWMLLANGAGHLQDFSGPFDRVMAFFFYLPNLLVVEVYLRARAGAGNALLRWSASAAMTASAGLFAVGTYYFTLYYWWPGITGATVGG